MQTIKYLKKLWTKLKAWFVGILVALGLVTTTVIVVLATPTEFTYQRATEYTDGTPLPLSEIATTRLYCTLDGQGAEQLVATEQGADGNFSVDLAPGSWECVATHVATNSLESALSEPVTKQVLPFVPPNPPTLDGSQ